MTANEAYAIILKKFPKCYAKICIEFDDFYIFSMASYSIPRDKTFLNGIMYDAVDKKTGRIFKYDITSNPDALENAEAVEVDTLFDIPIDSVGR